MKTITKFSEVQREIEQWRAFNENPHIKESEKIRYAIIFYLDDKVITAPYESREEALLAIEGTNDILVRID